MNKMRLAVKMDVELNVVDEFCSIPIEHDVESYAQELCDEQKKKDPSTNFTYYIDYDKIDEMSGETIGYIYKEEKMTDTLDKTISNCFQKVDTLKKDLKELTLLLGHLEEKAKKLRDDLKETESLENKSVQNNVHEVL